MIIDAFTFNNEFELLELRLNILKDVVDEFLLVEARQTHSGIPKPLYYKESNLDYPNVRHVIVDDFPSPLPWEREGFQRNCILEGLLDLKPNDLVIVSDADEIPRPEIVGQVGLYRQKMFYFYLDLIADYSWSGSFCVPYYLLEDITPNVFRRHHHAKQYFIPVIEDGGWHWSYLGGEERVINKLESFAHTELNTKEIKSDIRGALEEKRSLFHAKETFNRVDIDETFPLYLRTNLDQYKHLLYT